MVNVFGYRARLFDVGGAIGIAGMAVMLTAAIVRHTRFLYQAERIA
jgi:hypothetical protein